MNSITKNKLLMPKSSVPNSHRHNHQRMKSLTVHYEIDLNFIRNIGKLDAPPLSKFDQNIDIQKSLIHIIHCLLHHHRGSLSKQRIKMGDNPQNEHCDHTTPLNFIQRCAGSLPTKQLLLRAHIASASNTRNPGRLRSSHLGVDIHRLESGFVTAKVNVAKRLEEALDYINNNPEEKFTKQQKALFLLYIISILHPFEDGNGRTMRVVIPTIAASRNHSYLCFWLFFSIYTKFNMKSYVESIQRFATYGNADSIQSLYMDAISLFQKLSEGWEEARIELIKNQDFVLESINDALEGRLQ